MGMLLVASVIKLIECSTSDVMLRFDLLHFMEIAEHVCEQFHFSF